MVRDRESVGVLSGDATGAKLIGKHYKPHLPHLLLMADVAMSLIFSRALNASENILILNNMFYWYILVVIVYIFFMV